MKEKVFLNYKTIVFIFIIFLLIFAIPNESLARSITNIKTNISSCNVTLSYYSTEYIGSAIKPKVTVKKGTKTLNKDKDYTVVYSNNVNVGIAKVTIKGKGSYIGSISKTFTINKKSISGSSVTLSNTSYTYTGSAIKPTVTVKIGTKTLKKDKDYTVVYSNNVNAGTAKVIIYGKGNYTGSISKTFTINKKSISESSVTLSNTSYTYKGCPMKPRAIVKIGTKALVNDRDYTVVYSNNVNAGTAKVTINGNGNYTGSISKTFTINKKSIPESSITLSNTSYTYTGSAIKPTVTVKIGTKALMKDRDYTVVYSNNVNAGTAKVIIKGIGNYTDSVTKTFKIDKADINYAMIENMERYMLGLDSSLRITYNGKVLEKNIDYTMIEKKYYRLNKQGSSSNLAWEIEFQIKGINNFDEQRNRFDYNDFILHDGGLLLYIVEEGVLNYEKRKEYDFDYINRMLNYQLSDFIININKTELRQELYGRDPKVPALGYPYDDSGSWYILNHEVDFEYERQGDYWVITGINSFYGTMKIKVYDRGSALYAVPASEKIQSE